VRLKADTNESNTGLFKELKSSASKVALYPLLMLPTLPTMPQPAAIRFGPQRPASLADSRPLFAFAGIWNEFRGDRGTKSRPIPRPHLIYGFPTTSTHFAHTGISDKFVPIRFGSTALTAINCTPRRSRILMILRASFWNIRVRLIRDFRNG
jgi:hypothetical protein